MSGAEGRLADASGEGRLADAGGEGRLGDTNGADRLAEISGALLTGGASRRMGTDKAALTLDGMPLALRTARLLAELFHEVLWVGTPGPVATAGASAPSDAAGLVDAPGTSDTPGLIGAASAPGPAGVPSTPGPADAPGPVAAAGASAPVRFVADPPGPRCALRGVVAALDAARAPRVLICATDLPALSAPLLLALTALPEADIVLPRTTRVQPLCALYRREPMLQRARAHLAGGRLKLEALVHASETTWLEGFDLQAVGGEAALANINTPQEWQAWRRLHARQRSAEATAREHAAEAAPGGG